MKTRIGHIDELALLNNLLKEAATRLKQKGSKQWAHVLEDRELEVLKDRLSEGEVLVFEENNQVVGMCYLYQKPNEWDFGLWEKQEEEGAYYLHKVVIGNRFVGKNYGEKIIEHIIDWVSEKNGKAVLLDCKADVSYLNSFYQKVGFIFVKKCEAGRFDELFADFNLYEYLIR